MTHSPVDESHIAARPQARTGWACQVGGLRFAVTCPSTCSAALRAYLTEYLPSAGDNQPAKLDLPAFRLDLFVDAASWNRGVEASTSWPVTRHIEAVAGVVLSEVTTPSGRRWYAIASDAHDRDTNAWIAAIHGRRIELYCCHAEHVPRQVVRIMREAMLRTHENHGGVIFHAAGFDLDGAGVMICGTGTAGKTTTMTALLHAGGGSMLAGDRLVLDKTHRMVTVPLPVKAGRGTVEAFPELHRAARSTALSRPQPGPLDQLPRDFGSELKVEFSAREYAAALGASLSSGARLRTILVPRFSDSAHPFRLRRLGSDDARAALAASCFTPRDEFWVTPWLVRRHQPDAALAAHAERICGDLAARVECVEVTFGVRNRVDRLAQALAAFVEERRS